MRGILSRSIARKPPQDAMHIYSPPGPHLAKTMSFAAVHFSVAFSLAYLLKGDFVLNGTVAIVEPMVIMVAYFFHEIVWARWRTRRTAAAFGVEAS